MLLDFSFVRWNNDFTNKGGRNMQYPISEKTILEEYESYFPDNERLKQHKEFVKALVVLLNTAYVLGVQEELTKF